ncbi:hypothetical protein H2199_008343 [Coniosporium tulheliwenetii]|uniref:Uncharacterized protein n=1 Tax=Coniosporium tulheliwenetii TaxID=3383036 RepID=A0ACC2YLK1_9PEZI|nr:hypothetical protein H2199_008343 [Cladosporium sp. JES 115]
MSVYAKSKHGGRRVWQPPQMTDEERIAREKAWAATVVAPSKQPEPRKRVPPLSANFVPASSQAEASPASKNRSAAAADTAVENILTAAGAWERAWRQTQSASSRSRGQTTLSTSTASHTSTTTSSSGTASTVIETGNGGPAFSDTVQPEPGSEVQKAVTKQDVPAADGPLQAVAPLQTVTAPELSGVSKLHITDQAHGTQQTNEVARTRLALLESLEKLGEQALRRRYAPGSVHVKDDEPPKEEEFHGKSHEAVKRRGVRKTRPQQHFAPRDLQRIVLGRSATKPLRRRRSLRRQSLIQVARSLFSKVDRPLASKQLMMSQLGSPFPRTRLWFSIRTMKSRRVESSDPTCLPELKLEQVRMEVKEYLLCVMERIYALTVCKLWIGSGDSHGLEMRWLGFGDLRSSATLGLL